VVDSTKVLCPLFDKIEMLIPGDSPTILPSLDKMWNFCSLQKRRKMTLLKQFIKLEWIRTVLGPDIDLIPRPTLLLYYI